VNGEQEAKRERDLDYAVGGIQDTLWEQGFGFSDEEEGEPVQREPTTREENALAFAESMRASHAVIQEVIDRSDKSGAWYIAQAFKEKSRADAAVTELLVYKNRRLAVLTLHSRHVTSGLCMECGKPAPCPTVLAQVELRNGVEIITTKLPTDDRT
jgi:hypothetical protein